jgi:hypothetical protein
MNRAKSTRRVRLLLTIWSPTLIRLVAHDDRQVEERDVPLRDGRDLVVELEPDRNSRLETTGEPEERVPRTHERVDDERSASRGSGCDRSDVSADPGREPVARALDDRPAQQAHTVAVPLTRPETIDADVVDVDETVAPVPLDLPQPDELVLHRRDFDRLFRRPPASTDRTRPHSMRGGA